MKKSLSQWLRQSLEQPDLFAPLIRGTSVALSLLFLELGIDYGTRVALARWMGATEYGTYDYIISLGTFLGFLASLGLPGAVLRFIPEYSVKKDWGRLRGIVQGSWLSVLISSVSIAAIGTLVTFCFDGKRDFSSLVFLLGFWIVPLLALTRHQIEMTRATKNIALAYIPSTIALPVLVLAGTFFLKQYLPTITTVPVITLTILSVVLVLSVQLWLFRRQLPKEYFSVSPVYSPKEWFPVSLPMLLSDGASVVLAQTDILAIGALLGSFEVGIYSAALKTSIWVSFVLRGVNAIAAPMFATLHAQGNREDLQKLVTGVARWMFWPTLTIALLMIVFADSILSLFGPEFIVAREELIILILGQLVNVGAGSVGYLLGMSGHQNKCAYVFSCSALVNLVLNWILIPIIGITGAAIATAFSMALWNIWLHRLVVKNLGVRSSIFGAKL